MLLWTITASAKVAELADAPDLGSGSRKAMGVRLPPFASFDSPSAGLASGQASRMPHAQPEAIQLANDENRTRRRQRNPQEPARRNSERRGRRARSIASRATTRARRAFPASARARRRRGSSSSGSRSRSSTTWRTISIPRAVDDALRERGVEPVDTPDIRDVNVEEGQPLTFTASFDTVPAFEPGDYVDDLAAAAVESRSRTRR